MQRDTARKVHEGFPRGISKTDNGRKAILAGGRAPLEPGAIHANELGKGL